MVERAHNWGGHKPQQGHSTLCTNAKVQQHEISQEIVVPP